MKPAKLIGHAGQLRDLLSLRLKTKDRAALMFSGPSGIGKSSVALSLAEELCGGAWGVQHVIGRKVTIHWVTQLAEEMDSSSLYGTGWKVAVIDEIDTAQKDAVDALLYVLDRLPVHRAIIGTTNLPFEDIPERFRSRFQRYAVRAPEPEEIESLILAMYSIPPAAAREIAELSGGNVRSACLDAEAWAPVEPKVKQPVLIQTSLAALGI